MTNVARIFCASILLIIAQPSATFSVEDATKPEDIFVARSLRLTRIKPTDYCKNAGDDFEATAEDTYDFLSVATQSDTGQITDNKVRQIGKLRACYGKTSTPEIIKFFAEGQLGNIEFRGDGDCVSMRAISPATGILPFRCHLVLSKLPEGYVGGLLVTNTVSSKIMIGDKTDPPGYAMPSIATVRLWKSESKKSSN